MFEDALLVDFADPTISEQLCLYADICGNPVSREEVFPNPIEVREALQFSTYSGWWEHIDKHIERADGGQVTTVWTLRRSGIPLAVLQAHPELALPIRPGVYHRGYHQAARAMGISPRTFVNSGYPGDDFFGIKMYSVNSYG